MRNELSEPAARDRAVELASAKFAATVLRDAEGKVVAAPALMPSMFKARREGSRWLLSSGGPAGAWAEVSFDLEGSHESVEVGFASD